MRRRVLVVDEQPEQLVTFSSSEAHALLLDGWRLLYARPRGDRLEYTLQRVALENRAQGQQNA